MTPTRAMPASARTSTPRANQTALYPSQRTIIQFSRQGDRLTSERVEQHVLVVGGTGSSKSTASMDMLTCGAMDAQFGCLILCAKASAADEAWEAAVRTGQEKRVIMFGPGSGQCFNWADYEYQNFGDGKGRVDNLMSVFTAMTEVMLRSSQGKQSEPFWEYLNLQGFRNLFFIDGKANGSIDLSRILKMWQSLPQNFDQLDEPHRRASLRALIEAKRRCNASDLRSFELAETWLTSQMPALSERTRSCIEAMAIGMLDPNARETMYEAMGGKSTWTPKSITEEGRIVIVAYDVKRYGGIGKLIQVACKKSVEMESERRLARYRGKMETCRPVAIIADELQFVLDSGDLDFLRTSREARAGMIGSIQSIPSVISELGGGAQAEVLADAIFGQFQTKVYHQNGCDSTNKKTSGWVGEKLVWTVGESEGTTVTEQGASQSSGYNLSEQLRPLVPTIEFKRSARGGEANKYEVRVFVTMEGHFWKCNGGEDWARIKIFQHCEPSKSHVLFWPLLGGRLRAITEFWLRITAASPLRYWNDLFLCDPRAPVSMFMDRVPTARIFVRHPPLMKLIPALWRAQDWDERITLIARWWGWWMGKTEDSRA